MTYHDHPSYGPGPTPSATDFRGQGISTRGNHPPTQRPLQDAILDARAFDRDRFLELGGSDAPENQ